MPDIGALRRDMEVGFADARAATERTLKEQARWFITALIAVTGVMMALLVNIRLQLP